jgi:Rrf2 family transcriptional regulator, cysteine metabolism repressor
MKISTRGRYGIRLMIDLAEHADEGHVPLASIAERQSISPRYLEQVAVILRRAGYIRSIKGASGGYALAKKPSEIAIGEALRELEGDILIVDPPRSGDTENALRRCIRRAVYDRINDRVSGLLDNITLASMLGTVDPESSYMYFI